MPGYTPLFSSILDGTLYGKWPHNGLWALLLSQADRYGCIDVVPQLLAAKIGVSEEVLLKSIANFMEPDPGSRTGDLEGRRLELIDPSRNWGWRVINHSIYREKQRKRNYDTDRTLSGRDAERKKAARESNGGKTPCPAMSRESRDVPLSSASASASASPTPEEGKRAAARASPRVVADSKSKRGKKKALTLHDTLPVAEWGSWLEFRKRRRMPLDDQTLGMHLKLLARYSREQQTEIIETSINAGWQGLFAPKGGGKIVPLKRRIRSADEIEAEEKAEPHSSP
jgi:hypothetical protein